MPTDSEHIQREIQRLDDELGHPPQATHLFIDSDITQYEFYEHYDRYDTAVIDAGLDPDDIPQNVTDTDLSKEELHERVATVAAQSDGALKMNETLREANVARSVVYEYHDTWGDLLDELNLAERRAAPTQGTD